MQGTALRAVADAEHCADRAMAQMTSLVALFIATGLCACGHEPAANDPGNAASAASSDAIAQNPFFTTAWWEDRDVADWRSKFSDRCEIHDTKTAPDVVEMYDGTVFFGVMAEMGVDPAEYSAASDTLFPNANSYAKYDHAHWAASVRYCLECRKEEHEWIEQHKRAPNQALQTDRAARDR